MTKVFD